MIQWSILLSLTLHYGCLTDPGCGYHTSICVYSRIMCIYYAKYAFINKINNYKIKEENKKSYLEKVYCWINCFHPTYWAISKCNSWQTCRSEETKVMNVDLACLITRTSKFVGVLINICFNHHSWSSTHSSSSFKTWYFLVYFVAFFQL